MRDDEGYRWGDDPADHEDLDAWLTRGDRDDDEEPAEEIDAGESD